MPRWLRNTYRRCQPFLRWVARFCVIATLVAAIVLLAGVVTFRFVDPTGSMVMAARILKGGNISYSWVPLKRISRNLVDAVVTSEDAKFCRHWGVDWGEIRAAVRRAQRTGDGPRGASTIPMQTARNLFLWQRRSYFRKAIEIPLAYAISAIWPKHRVIEVYLNIAEWAPGIFGAEAAARKHFSRSAAKITPRQAAQMAAALPNPHVRNAGRPGPRTRRLANHIEKRVKNEITKLGCIYQQ